MNRAGQQAKSVTHVSPELRDVFHAEADHQVTQQSRASGTSHCVLRKLVHLFAASLAEFPRERFGKDIKRPAEPRNGTLVRSRDVKKVHTSTYL